MALCHCIFHSLVTWDLLLSPLGLPPSPSRTQASILVADYALLRRDFHCELGDRSDTQIDAWLLANAAFVSAGQAQRMRAGGDHHALLGMNALAGGVDEVLDASRTAAGIRNRSFGRAANLLANGGKYWCARAEHP